MAAYWEIAAHSAYDVFSKYKYLIVNLVLPTSFLARLYESTGRAIAVTPASASASASVSASASALALLKC